MSAASERIASELRTRIVKGTWKPGTRLPARTSLTRELGSSASIVQEAVHQLVDEGFVEVGARKMGTRVATNPPHLSRYLLIFPFGPDDWGRLWHALADAAEARTKASRTFDCFYGVGGYRDIADYQAVIDDVRTQRVAGLIFASSADEFRGTPLLEAPGVARVAIAGPGQLPGIPKVHVDLQSFVQKAVAQLEADGRERLAIICASRAAGMIDMFREALADYGLTARSHWEQFASMRNADAARQVTRLLLHPGQSERPDGLIIADDNLIAGVTAGITDAQLRMPDELSVVAMTNFPLLPPAQVPVTRIGFDIPAVLDLLAQRLEQLANGETPPETTAVSAITDANFSHPPSN